MSEKKATSRSGSEFPAARLDAGYRGRYCERLGGWGLVVWLSWGILLEALHGFKSGPYLEDGLRREMWTLAHAHGTLLSVVALALAWSGPIASLPVRRALWCDRLFAAGSVLVPAGFLVGGFWHSEADPGIGVLLVPLGGFLSVSGLVTWLTSPRTPRLRQD